MKKIVPSATTHFINAITLYSITSSLTLTSTQCGTVPIPSTHNNPGLTNTDIIIYMTLDNTTQSEAVGTGSTCEFDSIQGNPVAGIITLNQKNFYSLSFDAMISTIIHEITHVLGFAWNTFSRWKKNNGSL